MSWDNSKAELNDVGEEPPSLLYKNTLSEAEFHGKPPLVENGEIMPKLNKLWQKIVSLKRAFNDQLIKFFHGSQIDDRRTRLYHVWPGNNVFFCGGRIICGPDPRGPMLTIMAITLTSWIFCAYIAMDFPHNSTPIIICSIILTFIVLVSLGMVSTIDPGIIPRNDQSKNERSNGRRIDENGVEVRLKYCRVCNIYRPPRSRHCSVCDNCVEKFDHHCPWIGQCIGLRNHKLYILFLFMSLIFYAYISTFSIQKIYLMMSKKDYGLIELLRNCPEAVALASFAFGAAWILGGLTCYHLYLVALNQTAYENFRQLYTTSLNPYDKGILSNTMEVLFVSSPSRVDFRQEVIRHDFSPSIHGDQV